jgi:hypothetical protein
MDEAAKEIGQQWRLGHGGVLLAIGMFWLSSQCKGDEDRQTNRTQSLGTR